MPEDDSCFELVYNFQKPVLVKGYILETANDDAECDPKDWVVRCHNIDDNSDVQIHSV